MERSYLERFGVLALAAGGMAVALAYASLLAGWSWSERLLRQPAAERLAPARFTLTSLPQGYVSQQSAYQTDVSLPAVLGWYARHFDLDQDVPQGELDNCRTLTKLGGHLFLQHVVTITLCSRPQGTLIIVDRSLALRW